MIKLHHVRFWSDGDRRVIRLGSHIGYLNKRAVMVDTGRDQPWYHSHVVSDFGYSSSLFSVLHSLHLSIS